MLREIPKVVQSIDNATVSFTSSPAGDHVSSTDINGSVIDRTLLGRGYVGCSPFAVGHGLNSTEVDRKITVGVKLQHGDSSDGSDMADFSTDQTPSDLTFLSSAMTTAFSNWTTGAVRIQSPPCIYDLRKAKRYIRPVLTPTINFNSTSTTHAVLNISGGCLMLEADEYPNTANTGAHSSSTST